MKEQQALPSAVATITYDAIVICPHCRCCLNLTSYPYDNDKTEYFIDENKLGAAVFGGVDTPAKWSGISIEYKCCRCGNPFNLTSIEI